MHEKCINTVGVEGCEACFLWISKGLIKQRKKPRGDLRCRHVGCERTFSSKSSRNEHERNVVHSSCLVTTARCPLCNPPTGGGALVFEDSGDTITVPQAAAGEVEIETWLSLEGIDTDVSFFNTNSFHFAELGGVTMADAASLSVEAPAGVEEEDQWEALRSMIDVAGGAIDPGKGDLMQEMIDVEIGGEGEGGGIEMTSGEWDEIITTVDGDYAHAINTTVVVEDSVPLLVPTSDCRSGRSDDEEVIPSDWLDSVMEDVDVPFVDEEIYTGGDMFTLPNGDALPSQGV